MKNNEWVPEKRNHWMVEFEEKFCTEYGDLSAGILKNELKMFIYWHIAQTRQDTVREVIEIAKSRMLEEKPFSSNPSESIHPSIYNKALTHLIGQLREDYNIKDE